MIDPGHTCPRYRGDTVVSPREKGGGGIFPIDDGDIKKIFPDPVVVVASYNTTPTVPYLYE